MSIPKFKVGDLVRYNNLGNEEDGLVFHIETIDGWNIDWVNLPPGIAYNMKEYSGLKYHVYGYHEMHLTLIPPPEIGKWKDCVWQPQEENSSA